jgi:hypothetical protein
LPATINIRFKNTGNTIVQPYGNVFIQRSSTDTTPITALPVNDKRGYLLPGSERLLTTEWSDGFPLYQVTASTGEDQQKKEVWDWSKIANFRIGPYVSKLVAVYNDGQRDIAIEKEAGFWVLPWKIILGVIVAFALIAVGVWTLFRKIWIFVRKGRKRPSSSE